MDQPDNSNTDSRMDQPENSNNDSRMDRAENINNDSRMDRAENINNDSRMDQAENSNNDSRMDQPENSNTDSRMDQPENSNNDSRMDRAENINNDSRMDRAENINNDSRMDQAENSNNDSRMDQPENSNNDSRMDQAENINNDSRMDQAENSNNEPRIDSKIDQSENDSAFDHLETSCNDSRIDAEPSAHDKCDDPQDIVTSHSQNMNTGSDDNSGDSNAGVNQDGNECTGSAVDAASVEASQDREGGTFSVQDGDKNSEDTIVPRRKVTIQDEVSNSDSNSDEFIDANDSEVKDDTNDEFYDVEEQRENQAIGIPAFQSSAQDHTFGSYPFPSGPHPEEVPSPALHHQFYPSSMPNQQQNGGPDSYPQSNQQYNAAFVPNKQENQYSFPHGGPSAGQMYIGPPPHIYRFPPGGQGYPPVPEGQGYPPVPGRQGYPPVPGRQGYPPVPGGQEFTPVPGGQGYQPVPGGQGYQPVPGGQGYQPVPGGQGYQPVPGGQGYQPVPGGQGFSPVPGGQGLSPVPGGQGLSPVPSTRDSVPQGYPGHMPRQTAGLAPGLALSPLPSRPAPAPETLEGSDHVELEPVASQPLRRPSGDQPASQSEHVAKGGFPQTSHKFEKESLQEEIHVDEEKEDKPVNSIVVRRKEKPLKDEEIDSIKLYFENKRKSGGGEIETILYDENKKAVYITFKKEGVAREVLSKKLHKIGKMTLEVELWDVSTVEEEKETKNINSIVVKWKGQHLKEEEIDFVEMYFENKRKSGGGIVEHFHYDENKKAIYITFKEDGVAHEVLSKKLHKIGKMTLEVELWDVSTVEEKMDEEKETKNINSIVVKWKGQHLKEEEIDFVEMYFENEKKSGGGVVEKFHYDENKKAIYITFKEDGVAQRVVSKTAHKIGKKILLVELSDVLNKTSAVGESETQARSSIVVEGLRKNFQEKDAEVMKKYFENVNKSNGGSIAQITFDGEKRVIHITFEEDGVAERVVEKKQQFQGRSLKVTLAAATDAASDDDEEEDEPQTTVVVEGCGPHVTDDAIILYFENKRKGGGVNIEHIRREENGQIYITFKSEEDVKTVLAKEHTIEKNRLTIKVYEPPRMYKNRFLLTKVPESCTVDMITNFTEAKLHYTVAEDDGVLFSEKPGVVMVTLEDNIDFNKVSDIFTRKALEGIKLNFTKVPVSKSIIVKNVPEKVSSDAVRLYFENSRRSGGSEVSEVKLISKCAVVTFKDEQVIQKVLAKKHKLSDHDVVVSQYHDCLGLFGGTSEPIPHKLPDNVILDDLDPYKIKFLKQKRQTFEALQQQLKSCWAEADVNDEQNQIHVKPIFALDRPDSRNIAASWNDKVISTVRPLMDAIEVHHVECSRDIWSNMMEKLDDHFKKLEEGIIFQDETRVEIVIVGMSVGNVVEKVQKLLQDLAAAFEREKRKTTQSKIFNPCFLKVLEHSDFVSTLKASYPDVSVKIDATGGQITVTCVVEEIHRIFLLIFEEQEKIVKQTFTDFPSHHLQLLQQPSACQQLCAKLSTPAALEASNTSITIHSLSQHSVSKVRTFLKDSIAELRNELDHENLPIVDSDKFRGKVMQIKETHANRVTIVCNREPLEVVTAGVDGNDVERASNEINDYIKQNSIYTETVSLAQNKTKFIVKHGQTDIEGITGTLRERHVKIICKEYQSEYSITIKATRDGLRAAQRAVTELAKSIKHESRSFADKPGMKTFLTVDVLNMVENKTRTVIEMNEELADDDHDADDDDDDDDDESDGTEELGGSNRQAARRKQYERGPEEAGPMYTGQQKEDQVDVLTVKLLSRILITEMDMGKEEADVLVNSSNTSLQLANGAVSKSIVEHGGPTLQEECKQKYPKGINMGDIAVTGPGKLPYVQNVYHVCLPDFDKNGEKVLRSTMQKILTMTVKAELKTVAIPALGSGILKYPRDLVAKVMYSEVLQFINNGADNCLHDVKFVLHPSDEQTIHAFKAEAKKHLKEMPAQMNVHNDKPAEESKPKGFLKIAWNFGAKLFESKDKSSEKAKVRKPKPLPASVSKASSSLVSLTIYSDQRSRINEAADFISRQYESKQETKVIDEECIKTWDDEMIKSLQAIANICEVDVHTDQKKGQITLVGLQKALQEANAEVQKRVRENEKVKKEKEIATNLAKIVRWYTLSTQENGEQLLDPYEADLNFRIEKAFKANESKFIYNDNGVNCVVDFGQWKDYPEQQPDESLPVIRKNQMESGNVSLPDTWTPMDTDVKMVKVNANTEEYTTVEQTFSNTIGSQSSKIIRIDRIQNRTLYEQYQLRVQAINKDKQQVTNEQTLWHGTFKEMLSSITAYGFNRSFCDPQSNEFGQGVYFTKTAELAVQKYCKEDSQNQKYLFLSKVITGEYAKSTSSQIRVPPCIDKTKPEVLYDSVVDDSSDPTTFVIFNDTQAYPEYLIVVQS